jgi:hypothetical protein
MREAFTAIAEAIGLASVLITAVLWLWIIAAP